MTMNTTIPSDGIVVGIDGSNWSDLALDWAARQASSEGRPLVLVHAVHPPSTGALGYLDTAGFRYGELLDQLRKDAEELLTERAEKTRAEHELPDIRRIVQLTDARVALLDAAVDASMLVVGTRGLGPLRQLLLGSVSLAMTKHSSAPVVVVRPASPGPHEAGVLVGVSGDDRDGDVLEFGFRIAHARGLPVTAVHSFWDVVGGDETREVRADEPGYEDQLGVLMDAVRRPSERYPSVPVHHLLSRGFADVQLIAASRHAELLVLGHRRKPVLRELIYGSVAPRVVEHAHCSVAVVPVGDEPEATDPATV
jgi:nucleotide-binding universal stress UspA family protein